MNPKNIELAKDTVSGRLPGSNTPRSKRAAQLAASTNTELIVMRNGECVRVKPGKENKPE